MFDFIKNFLGSDVLNYVLVGIKAIYPIIIFPIIFEVTRSLWLFWRQSIFKAGIKFVVLEMRIPREILKSPQAMEQVLVGMHSLRNSPSDFNRNIREKYWDGEVTKWFTLEIVSDGGELHFYIVTDKKLRSLVETSFFSYYPDLELVEVPDYMPRIPKNTGELEAQDKDIWGVELVLGKEEAYPIKSYTEFESPDDAKKFDPASVFLEIMSKIQKVEFLSIQIVIAPGDPKWFEAFDDLLEEIKGLKQEEDSDIKNLSKLYARTPGETEVLKAVEKNLSKPCFDTIIRIFYLSSKGTFLDSYARRGMIGAFNQYSNLELNSFKQNFPTGTGVLPWAPPFFFSDIRSKYRKNRFLNWYINREVPPETKMGRWITSYFWNKNYGSKFVKLNTESIASIFHPPTNLVLTAPHIKRMESKKASPSAGMSIFGDEKDIEMFTKKQK